MQKAIAMWVTPSMSERATCAQALAFCQGPSITPQDAELHRERGADKTEHSKRT